MEKQEIINEEKGNDVNHVFQSDKQWAVAQEKGTVYLNTLSWTRKESIKKFMADMDDKLKWEYFKKKYGIHCKKVTVSFQNGW
jgi:hypothetical protein